MVWVRRIAIVLGVLALLFGAGVAWFLTAKPWIPKLEVVDPAPAGRRVSDAEFVANFYPAPGDGARPAVIVLGGSEGGLGSEMTDYAKALQAEGYSALHVGYHRGPGMAPTLENIPLELFDKAIDWLKAQEGVDPERLAIVGWSRGSEAAQLIAATRPEIRALVLGMPSNVVWAGFDWEKMFSGVKSPAWTRAGAPVPYVAVEDIGYSTNAYSSEWQAKFVDFTEKRPEVVIPVESIRGRILYVCGEQDRLWPSCPMARLGAARAAKGGKSNVDVLAFKDAGHFAFGVPLASGDPRRARLSSLGGTAAGNDAAMSGGLERAKAFLAEAFAAAASEAPTGETSPN
jgi:hypothetical protein